MTADEDHLKAAIERALAELRAIPVRVTEEAEPTPAQGQSCCPGDRPGYQWHQRSGALPACEASLRANRAYQNAYQRDTGRTTRAGRRKRSAA